MIAEDITVYAYDSAEQNSSHNYLLPPAIRLLGELRAASADMRLFEVGCGNGSVASAITSHGWWVTGVHPSSKGIQPAQQVYPSISLFHGAAYDDLASQFGQFPVVLSLEVVEYVYDQIRYAARWTGISQPCGTMGISSSGQLKRCLLCSVRRALSISGFSVWDVFPHWQNQ